MTDLSLIASRLALRAVDLDVKTSDELLHLLIDELRTHDKELVTSGIFQFLQLHKCDLLPSTSSDEWDEWITSFEKGEKRILYDLLYWAASNSDHLAQRAYLAPFLLPIEVPEELLSNNDNLFDMEGCYRELQHDFIEIHKTFQSLKESDNVLTMSELNAEIGNAERERKQLLQRSQRTENNSAQFQQLLSLTSTLREAQAREAELKQQKNEQLQLSQSVDNRLKGERRISSILSNNANSIDQCITELKTESEEAILKLETGLIPKRLKLEAAVAKNERDAAQPSLPEDDIAYLEELLFQLDQKRQQCNDKDSVSILKQAAALSSKLVALKQDASEKSGMNNVYSRENQRLRDELKKKDSEMTCGVPNLQEKIKLYDEEKEEILAAQKHNLELEGKEEDLTKKLQAIEQTLQREEEKGEISGYRKVSKTLDDTFQDTCVLNETKSEILEEMSAIVQSIGEKKHTLEPMIEKLKQDRSVFLQIRDEHNIHKSRYEEVQQLLLDENKSLEERASQMQKECEEREYLINLLTTTESITASSLEQTLEDELQPSFPTTTSTNLSQLYEDKMYQLQQLQNELSKEHQDKKGGQDYNSRQEAMFQSLKKLLEMKQRSLCEQ